MAMRYLNYYEVRYYPATNNQGARLGIFKDGRRVKIVQRNFDFMPDEQAVLEVSSIEGKEVYGIIQNRNGWIIVVE